MADSDFLHQRHSRFSTQPGQIIALVGRASGNGVESLQRIVNGYDNEVYQAAMSDGPCLYIRIRRHGESDFSGEAWAMGLARDAGVPVPEVVGLDRVASGDAELDAMVVTAAPGLRRRNGRRRLGRFRSPRRSGRSRQGLGAAAGGSNARRVAP